MKNIHIVFPDFNLSYSPTTIGLYQELKAYFNVKLYSIFPIQKNVRIIENSDFIYIKRLDIFDKIYISLKYIFLTNFNGIEKIDFYRFKRQENLFKKTKQIENNDVIIAIDADTYWFYKKKGYERLILLSLEIKENDVLINYLKNNPPLACIIQSKIRFEYFFKNNETNYLELPNTINYDDKITISDISSRKDIIFNGTALKEFGLISCLDFINKFSNFKLHIIGFVNDAAMQLINSNDRIYIDSNYYESAEMINKISCYKYAICFYDRDYTHINTFNYETAPSGKLYAYLMAGVPIVCTNQIGLRFIEENNCGICIKSTSPEEIFNAIKFIDLNYEKMSGNCRELAQKLSFDNYTQRVIDFLEDV